MDVVILVYTALIFYFSEFLNKMQLQGTILLAKHHKLLFFLLSAETLLVILFVCSTILFKSFALWIFVVLHIYHCGAQKI